MKKFIFLIFILISFSCKKEKEPETPEDNQAFRGKIVSTELLKSYSVNQIDSIINSFSPFLSIILQAQYPIDIYRIEYETVDTKGIKTIASGALAIPKAAVSFPLASYQHGTVLRRQDVPSREYVEMYLGVIIGSLGYVMAMPDYLGFGSSVIQHPYMHAESEATAVIDMLRASKTKALEESVSLNGKVFLLGYSQGAHATMAALQEIEKKHLSEFNIAACAPMSGPYDLAGVQLDSLLRNKANKTASLFIPYTYMGFKDIYNLPSYEHVFVDPYDTMVPDLFDGTKTFSYVNALMPDTPHKMLKPDVVAKLQSHDVNDIFYASLKKNNVYNWKPVSPLKIIYCTGDELVFFQNSIVAYNYFQSVGSGSVKPLQNAGNYNHENCTLFALIAARTFFNDYYN